MSNVQQLQDRLTALENETSKEIASRLKENDKRAKEEQQNKENGGEE